MLFFNIDMYIFDKLNVGLLTYFLLQHISKEMYARDGLHLSGKGAAVFAEGLSGAVASGLGKVRYLN